MTIANTTTLSITRFNEGGIEVPHAQLKIVSDNPFDKALFLTANGNGQIVTTIPRNANLQFKLERLDNKSTKGSFFTGTIE